MQDSPYNFSFLLDKNCMLPMLLNIKFNKNNISCTILQPRASVLSCHHKVIV